MARLSEAVWAGEQSSQTLMTRHDIVCVHTIVGYAPAAAAHFSTKANGQIIQSRDTKYRSAANLDGNHRVIAIENEDHGPAFGAWSGSNVPAFTPQQIEAIAKICAWAYHTHSIPLVLCPDSKPGSRGIAYHRQGCNGNFEGMAYGGRVSDGELWSSAYGKVCPGDVRIRQLIDEIIPRARVIAGLDVPEEDDDMANVLLVHGDNTALVPGKTYRWGDLVFMVKLDPELPGGAVRAYMPNGVVFRMAARRLGSPEQWRQADVDSIPFALGGEPPDDVVGR
jgi:hypothetical protein